MKEFNTHTFFQRRLSAWCALLLLVLLAACSSIRFTYNHGDTLLYWWINAYIDVDSEQKPLVKKDIDELFHWHRRTQLRDYAQILRVAQKQLSGNPTREDLLADYRQIRDETRELLMRSVPDLTDLVLTLKPEQLANMEEKFEKNNREYRKKFMSGSEEKRKKVRYEKTMDQLNLWFGSFSSEQEDQVRRLLDAHPLDNEVWLAERMRRQQQILALVRRVQVQRLPREQVSAMITALIRDTVDRMDAPERKAFYDNYTESTVRFILDVIHLTTPAQRAFALHRMQGWIDDFSSLAAEGR